MTCVRLKWSPLRSVFALVGVFLLGLWGASPALASPTVVVSVSPFAITPSTISATSFSLDVQTDGGTSVSVWGSSPGVVENATFSTPCDADGHCVVPTALTVQFNVSASSTTQYVNIKYSAGGAVVQLTVLPEQSGGDGSVESTEGPGLILQQIPRLPGDDCSTVDQPELNWSGVSGRGWAPSWSWWMNEGQGGPVCTRTLEYSRSESMWVVAERTR